MREILFRGKRLQGKNWVEGYLYKSDINKRERESGKATLIFTPDCDTFIYMPETHNSVMVIAETVGQYTGLTDKNGRKIFEGDILRLKNKNEEDYWRAIVVFGNPNGEYSWGWQLQNITPNSCVNPDILLWVETEVNYVSCEVIGNIHDNPNLLGGEKA